MRKLSATTLASLLSLGFLSFVMVGGIPSAAAFHASSNCTAPSVPTGSLPALNSTFTLTIIGATGQTVTFNQNTIMGLAACSSWGGFVHHSVSDDYGNYTGIPVLTLINLVGGMTSAETVTATSGTDGYQTTYTYSEVESGTGWGSVYTTASPTTAVTTTPPMYLVLAYLWNGNPISAYSCTSLPSTPCTSSTGTESSGTGPLRTVTIDQTTGYLIGAGSPWNKAVTTIQVNPPEQTLVQAAAAASGTAGGGLVSTVYTTEPVSTTGVYEQVCFQTALGNWIGFEVPAPGAGLVTYQVTTKAGLVFGYVVIPLQSQSSVAAIFTAAGETLTAVSTP